MLRSTLQSLAFGASRLPKQVGVFSPATSWRGVAAAAAAAAEADTQDTALPEAVDYDERYASQITIAGHLGRDLKITQNKFGVVGSTSMAVPSGRGKPTTWLNLLISDEQKALQAQPLMHKGARVQVVGLLDIGTRLDDDGNQVPQITVHVDHVDVVEKQQAAEQEEEAAAAATAAPAAATPAPQQQQQQRQQGQFLSLPAGIAAPAADADVTQLSKEQQWAHVAAHPYKWWDQRPRKTKNTQPDFKTKDKVQDVALWITGRDTPAWVAAQAAGGEQQQQQQAPPAAAPAAASAAASPAAAATLAPKPRGRGAAAAAAAAPAPPARPAPPPEDADVTQLSKEQLWAHVDAHPHKWWDNRSNKRSEKGPDYSYKSRDVKVALWITSKDTPAWAKDKFTPQE